jgi:glycosidase
MKFFSTLILFFTFFYLNASASSIIFHTKNATVWLPEQIISGSLIGFNTEKIIVHINDSSFEVKSQHQQFSFKVLLADIKNIIVAEAKDGDKIIHSNTLIFELGFKPLPVVKPFATNKKNIVTLHSQITYNPYGNKLSYQWLEDKRNPASVKIIHSPDGTVTVKLPQKKGIYYFNLLVKDKSDSVQYQTFVIKTDSIHCFNIETDHSGWIDTAVIYEIATHVFVKNGKYDDIRQKLPELKSLGINCIWLQPVFETHKGGQGYDVVDYFSLRPAFGNEAQLQQLISAAKSLNIKVLFDFVPNHTSVFHPYALECARYKEDSHYYNFYQHTNDGAPYSSLYHIDSLGFIHYFWKDLVNLNFQNEEVQRWIIEACKYWLNKFDIDGYRLDAVWAVNARNPEFGRQLQMELKSIKPDMLLLAEDKGADPLVYKKGFDAAYDWEIDTIWISHWSWQYDYTPKNDRTIFNYPDVSKRDDLLRKALFKNGDTLHLRLRFLENNDVPRFVEIHDLKRTKMAAALEFTLPGIPLIYNGQEIGSHAHPYSSKPVFLPDKTIRSFDKDSLFEYYQRLITLRNQNKSLHSINIKNLKVDNEGGVVAYHRWKDEEHFIVAINMSDQSQSVKIFLKNTGIIPKKKTTYVLTDVLSNEIFSIQSGIASVRLNDFSTRILKVHELKDFSVADITAL